MQPGRARTSYLGVLPVLIARWVGWVAPVCPTHGVLALSCPSAALRVHVRAVSCATCLLFTGVPARCIALCVRCPGPLGFCSAVCPLCVLCCLCGVLGHLAPVHRCARSGCCAAFVVSRATWLLFTGVPPRHVALRVRCPGPFGLCSPVCVRSVCCVACAVSWANWLLFTGVPAWCVALLVRCPGPLGSSSPMCPLGVLCCVCGVLGGLAPVDRCAPSVRYFACLVSWAIWLLFTGVPARYVVLRVRCPWPLGSCSPVCPLGALLCVCGVLGHLAPVRQGARSVCCLACAVFRATWLLFTGVPARCVVLRVRCPGRLGSCSPVFPLGVLCCVCGVLGHLAPVHRCARTVCCVSCAVSWATWLLFTCVPARCVVLHLRCPGPFGCCSPVCNLGALLCVCGVLDHLAPVHRSARSVCCVACAVSWANWLLFTGVPARCVALLVRCPGALGSCSPVCPLGVLCCVCGVLGHLAPVDRCAPSVRCFAFVVSWAIWLLFTVVPARYVVLRVRCPGPLGSCSPVCPRVHCFARAVSRGTWLLFAGAPALCVVWRVRCAGPLGSCSPLCPLGVLCCVCGVPGDLVLFTGVPAGCVVFRVRCPGPLGSCSPVCPLCVLCFLCGVLGHLAPVHLCARSVCCAVFAVSWAIWLLFTGVPPRCVALRVRCPGQFGSCSPVPPLGVLRCFCGVLGQLAPVHQCARSVCCFAGAVFWATCLLFTGVPARCVVLRVRCPGPVGSC